MSTINTFDVAERHSSDETLSARNIANLLLAGERVIVEPIGEVYLLPRDNAPPQIEFVFNNGMISAVVELEIERLEEYKASLLKAENGG